MSRHHVAILLLVGWVGAPRLAPPLASHFVDPTRTERPARISTNDNTVSAGVLSDGLLTVHLVTRVGMWYPDGDNSPGTPVQAFAEEGRPLLVPGPMIRVRAGTEVLLTLRNDIPKTTLIVHGLISHRVPATSALDSVQLESGSTRTLRLRLDAPGTYYYWGTTMGRELDERTREDAQLTGAIIVDSAEGPLPVDRVLVIGMWSDTSGRHFVVRKRMLVVVNGLSWPHTERLNYTVGDTVHWRLINASADTHPMHLHGFYFLVDSRGDGVEDTIYAKSARDEVVTNLMKPGSTMSMTWSPDRPGNWLFHCHLPMHFGPRGPLGTAPSPMAPGAHAKMNHALQGMSGLVMGVTVHNLTGSPAPVSLDSGARRQLRLVIRARPDGSATAPHFQFVLEESGATQSAVANDNLAAPSIVLTRGEPVSITVVNALSEPTAVHWHGIELESYYDGVAGFSGTAQRLAPVIAPGDSFVARFAPPRAGTFIYHTHIDEERQEPAGLAGPIIVLDARGSFDPATDLTVVASSSRIKADSVGMLPKIAMLNGSLTPAALSWRVGTRYRVRFINMTTGMPGLHFELVENDKPVRWRPLAKDGADLPVARQTTQAARQGLTIGETADVEVAPEHEGDQRLLARLNDGTVVAAMPVHVSAARIGNP
jgi:FtsP/CotA-like multicopper oxidase with cupredoxin domain